jgi:prepilin-type N-terminal cleavage/methylation domain-containing protein
MCARSSDRAARQRRGFTIVELIAVLLLVGVLAVVAMPRLGGALALDSPAWHDQLRAGLLLARGHAQGHRRLVCVTLATGEIRLTMARANPATTCDTPLPGIDGDARWAVDSHGQALSLSPAGTLFFQPDGRITSDGAGAAAVNATVGLAGEASIALVGETGHVD